MRPRRPAILVAALLVLPLGLSGCGSKPTEPNPVPKEPRIIVSPGSATVLVRGTKTFTAAVENLSDSSVTWRVTRLTPTPDTVSLGVIAPTGSRSALYTAPDRVVARFDYKIQIVAISVADTTVRGTATVTVPRVIVSVIPGSVSSVPPGTAVPLRVEVQNTPNPAFLLYVEDALGGDPNLGTWTQTGPATTVYQAPQALGTTTTMSLLAKSADDTMRVSTSIITVRRGFPLAVHKTAFSQYAPSWHPAAARLAYVQGGAPWEVAVWDFDTGQERTVLPIEWSHVAYDGRVSWSSDGSKIAVSAEVGGRRVIDVLQADGSGHALFAPDAASEYLEAAFVPKLEAAASETLIVTQESGGESSLRAYALSAGAGDPGRLLHAPGPGVRVRWPDAIRSSGVLLVAAERSSGSSSDVISIVDDGGGGAPQVVATGPGRRTQVRFAVQPRAGIWIDYIWDGDGTTHRVHRDGSGPHVRLYSDFFPELAGDVSDALQWGTGTHALSRLMPEGAGGMARIWLVEFPPPGFLGIPQREELELASIGVRGALSPSSWSRWLGTTSLTPISFRPSTLAKTPARR